MKKPGGKLLLYLCQNNIEVDFQQVFEVIFLPSDRSLTNYLYCFLAWLEDLIIQDKTTYIFLRWTTVEDLAAEQGSKICWVNYYNECVDDILIN